MSARGPWARLLVETVAGNDGSRAVMDVESLVVEPGMIRARAGGCDVTLRAPLVPAGIWIEVERQARGNPPLEAAFEGRGQSVHLDHVMDEDWDHPLVPREIEVACSCDGTAARCAHALAVAALVGEEIDRDPGLLLRWRGHGTVAEGDLRDDDDAAPASGAADWNLGQLPELGEPRPLPPGAVLQRLGPTGIRVGRDDLAVVLRRAYAAFKKR